MIVPTDLPDGLPGTGSTTLARDVDWCEAILAMSGTTNGHLAVRFEVTEGQQHFTGRR